MRSVLWVLLLMLGVGACARRMPPPGKPETQGPVLQLVHPLEGDTVHDTLWVRVEATDSSGVAWVRVRLDQTLIGADSSAPYEFLYPLQQVVDTAHHLTIEAVDTWDNPSRIRIWIVTRGGLPSADTLEATHEPHKKN